MEFSGYLDFWFRDRPFVERVHPFVELGIRRFDVWCWRQVPMEQLYRECKACGAIINSTFDDQMGSLADPADNELTYRSWQESLEMASRYEIPHLFIFSNQVEIVNGKEWTRRLSRNISAAEQYANLLEQTERILKLVEQTSVQIWVEGLNQYHIQGDLLVHDLELAADWVRRMDHPQFRLAFDCYHQQRSGGNLTYYLEKCYGLYPTFHIGDVPTRQEPGTGEINFPNLVRKLAELGFDGLVGMEFYPSTTEAEAWAKVQQLFSEYYSTKGAASDD
ncbi:MAG: TIM barrel protein [Anaerolineales bacterium]|nr:TIM barrel protein [Anaerolineales bacterium]MDW8161975.1 TIM barrel protein [Anaerolineales bacterium]